MTAAQLNERVRRHVGAAALLENQSDDEHTPSPLVTDWRFWNGTNPIDGNETAYAKGPSGTRIGGGRGQGDPSFFLCLSAVHLDIATGSYSSVPCS